ncbi:MAG: type II toxin-antitoxin system VapC family toxin [Phycisphaerae bacterium]|nr:type II toxin-antitoxin system VapC family toxin [Phycisphaerae bacterium]
MEGVKGYLLDTNVICDWLDETKPRHAAVSRKVEQAAQVQATVVTSLIVLGEIEYGIAAVGGTSQQSLVDFRAQVFKQFAENKILFSVTRFTTLIYGDLRARLFEKFGPKKRRRKGLRPEELVDPVTAKALGIQENDLWIAAQAIERNLILVTNDGMTRIREIAPELRVEDWAAAAS